jgi:hypothetical protein
VQYPPYETARLGEITNEYYFAAQCRDCRHGRRLDIMKLRERLGADFPVVQIRKRLRCERCDSRQIIVSFFTCLRSQREIVKFRRPAGHS